MVDSLYALAAPWVYKAGKNTWLSFSFRLSISIHILLDARLPGRKWREIQKSRKAACKRSASEQSDALFVCWTASRSELASTIFKSSCLSRVRLTITKTNRLDEGENKLCCSGRGHKHGVCTFSLCTTFQIWPSFNCKLIFLDNAAVSIKALWEHPSEVLSG